MQNVVSQLKNEFERAGRQANPVNSPIPSVSQSDFDEYVGNAQQPKRQAKNKTLAPAMKPAFDLKLDRITLPSFSGTLTAWIAFRDQFKDLVHENPNCTPIMKFYHLRSCLTGKAAEVINGFQLSETDNEAAWQALCQRFDKKSQIVAEYIKRVLHLPCLDRNPGKEKLLNMVDRTNQMLRVLPHFGLNVKHWDPMVLVILVEKIDSSTEAKWLDQIKKRENVKLSEFLEFLENQAAEAVVISANKIARPQQKPLKPQNKRAVLLTNAEPGPSRPVEHGSPKDDAQGAIPISRTKCPHPKCDQYHPPYRCQKFLSLTRAKHAKGGNRCSGWSSVYMTKSKNNSVGFENEACAHFIWNGQITHSSICNW